MIAAFMLHALMVGAWCAAAAWASERALAAAGWARRFAWLLGMLASVVIPLRTVFESRPAATFVADAARGAGSTSGTSATVMNLVELPALPTHDWLDHAVAWGWAGLSSLVLAIYCVAAWRLARRARGWLPGAQHDVLVAEDIGPAVFGLWRPQVVLPRWLESAAETTRRLVLQHERQHVAARDPQMLALALLLAALFPWHLPLLWQLRRLRFALELDCDARVLAANADPVDYGEALLLVNQRKSPTPAGAIALIERPSQLERRIRIMTTTYRFRRSIAALAVALAAVCSFAATNITAPTLAAPLKPTPSGANALRLGQNFEHMLADRFPGLLDEDHERMPMVVVLLNEDWSIARAAQVTSRDELPVDERTFGVIGLAKDDVPYVGNMGMRSPNNPKHVVLIVYTERNTPGKRFVSHVFPDTRAVDREVFRRYFPQAAKHGVPAGEQVWVLMNREGQVLRSGLEAIDPAAWKRSLESRYPGIKTQEITVTPVTDDAGEPVLDGAGKDVNLHSAWLAPGSPAPGI